MYTDCSTRPWLQTTISTSLRSAFLLFDMADAAGLFARAEALISRDGGVHPPPEVLLSWPVPNYVNPEDRGWESSIILMVVLGITSIIYIVRMWARLVVAKNAGLDDILMSIAMLPAFGLTISAVLGMSILLNGDSTNNVKLSEFMASNGTHGISHRRVRSRPARYVHPFITRSFLLADDSDCRGGRAQLPGVGNSYQSLHPLFLSTHNGNLKGRFRILDLGHDRLLHNFQHNILISDHIYLQPGCWILPPFRLRLES
jgi:hypothetical protein